jgi:hypothetical protein
LASFLVFAVWFCLVLFGIVGLESLGLISVLLTGLLLVFSRKFMGISKFGLLLRLLFGALLLLTFVELASFVLSSIPTALGSNVDSLGLHWGMIRLAYSNLAYPVLYYAYLVFALIGIGAFLYRVLPGKWTRFVRKVRSEWLINDFMNELEYNNESNFSSGFLHNRFVVVFAVIVSVVFCFLFVAFTVMPWSNPTGKMVSVDSPVYYQWVSKMRSLDANSALSFAFGNDRALFLILLYALSYVAPIVDVIQFAGALLLILLVLVTVFVLRLFTPSNKIMALGALLVPFSFQSLGLIYSGFFAGDLQSAQSRPGALPGEAAVTLYFADRGGPQRCPDW